MSNCLRAEVGSVFEAYAQENTQDDNYENFEDYEEYDEEDEDEDDEDEADDDNDNDNDNDTSSSEDKEEYNTDNENNKSLDDIERIDGVIYVNGKIIDIYSSDIEKISENKYKIIQSVSLKNDFDNYKIVSEMNNIIYNNMIIPFDDINSFFIDFDIDKSKQDAVEINSIVADTNDSELYEEYTTSIFEKRGSTNPYYTENAPKFSADNFDINGIKLGMNITNSIENLQKSYDNKNININCKENLNQEEDNSVVYIDDYIMLIFDVNSENQFELNQIELNNAKIWDKYGIKEEDIIKNYYSEKDLSIINGKYETDYKFLYGKEYAENVMQGEYKDGNYAYIIADNDDDTGLCYFDGKNILAMEIDSSSKVISSLILSRQ